MSTPRGGAVLPSIVDSERALDGRGEPTRHFLRGPNPPNRPRFLGRASHIHGTLLTFEEEHHLLPSTGMVYFASSSPVLYPSTRCEKESSEIQLGTTLFFFGSIGCVKDMRHVILVAKDACVH